MENSNTILSPNETPENPAVVTDPVVNPPEQTGTPETHETTAPSFSGIVGNDGALSEHWRDLLPEDIRNEPSLANIKHFSALAKSYVHAQKAIGANKVAVPGEHATQDEKNAFFHAIGRPDDPEKYTFKPAEGLPEQLKLDDNLMKGFREEAFRIGLTPEQFNAAVNFQAKIVADQIKAQEAAADAEYESTLARLQQEYGDKFESVIAQCNKAVQTFGIGETLKEHGLLNNYAFIKALANIGGKISETKLKGDPAAVVQNDPQTRINEITGNLNDPYYNREHPLHQQRVDEVAKLVASANAARR